MKKPDTSFEFIVRWIERASKNATNQGKRDSALLWNDALEHLHYLNAENRRLSKIIEKYSREEDLS